MTCELCQWEEPVHDPACPLAPGKEREIRTRLAAYHLGFISGRNGVKWGEKCPHTTTWNLGQRQGASGGQR